MQKIIKSVINYVTRNTKLIFVISLVLIFPLLFIFTLNQFIETADSNVKTVLQQKITATHDLLEKTVQVNEDIQLNIQKIAEKNQDLTKIQILDEVEDEINILYKLSDDKINGSSTSDLIPYRTSLIEQGETVIFGLENTEKIQAARAITTNTGLLYVFTEHNFSYLYDVLEHRVIYAYLSLTLIFLFLIALTYWVTKQINYRKKYFAKKEELNELSLFVDSLAHELRTPLTAIRGYATLIEENKDGTSSDKEYSSKVRESSQRLVVLVNDFLEAARIQSGKLKLNPTRENLKITIEDAVTELKPMAEIKNLSLKTFLPKDDVNLKTDHHRLKQVLINTINNAIKYTNEGEITVSLEKNSISTTIVVADSGSGISAENQKLLFSPFVRFGDSNNTEKVVGSGLGMWITKQIIEQLEGEIAVESIKDVGTHVIMKFKNKTFEE